MIPANLHEFLVACLDASASFIGLLFVGLSVVLQRPEAKKLADMDRLLAESSFGGLINIFFVCLVALAPGGGVATVSLIMAIIGLLTCWRLRSLSRGPTLIISGLVYLSQACFGLYFIINSSHLINVGIFETIMLFLFASSLLRAWGLTGIRND